MVAPIHSLTPLRTEDARILALESGPIRGHTLKVLVLEDTGSDLPVEELRSRMAERLRHEPRWAERLVDAPDVPTGFAWQHDARFDISRHVGAYAARGPIDDDGFRRSIADIMTAPLDRSRPLWRVDVIPRLADGRSVVIWKVHHCLADGLAVMRAGPRLLWSEQPPSTEVPQRTTPAAPGASAQLVPGARLARVAGYRGLMIREFRRVWHVSPLAGEVGPDRVAAFTVCDLDELRRLGKAVGPSVTVNDVLLAVVAGALRRWLQARREQTRTMKVQIPVSMHPDPGSDEPAGNRDSFLLVRLPVAVSDPVDRVRTVAEATARRKKRHDARAIYAMRASLSHAPVRLQHRLQRMVQGPHEYSLNISNVPGPRGPIHVLGRHVDGFYSFAEVAPHHGLRIAATSLEASLFIGLLADPHLVPDLDGLAGTIPLEVADLHRRLRAGEGVSRSQEPTEP